MLCLKKIPLLGRCRSNMGNFPAIKKYLPGACPAASGPQFVSFSQVLLLLLEENICVYIYLELIRKMVGFAEGSLCEVE